MNVKEKIIPLRSVLRLSTPYLWSQGFLLRFLLILSFILAIGGTTLTLLLPLFFKEVINHLSDPTSLTPQVVMSLTLIYGFAWIGSEGLSQLKYITFLKIVRRAGRDLVRDALAHIHTLSLKFHLNRKTGALIRNIERAPEGILGVYLNLLLFVIPTLIEICLVPVILLFLYPWPYAVTMALIIGIYLLFTLGASSYDARQNRNANLAENNVQTVLVDSLLNHETVKYFAQESHEIKRFDKVLFSWEKATWMADSILESIHLVQHLIIGIGILVLTFMAGQDTAHGHMTVGDFVLLNSYLLQLHAPLRWFGVVTREVRKGLTALEGLTRIFEKNPSIKDREDASSLQLKKADIIFDNVSFSYDGQRKILDQVSFTIPEGKSLAIVGGSGGGKSTIGRLLLRFFDVGDGAIYINHQNISHVTQASLRQAIGVVPQDTILFNDTLLYNIAYGKMDSSPEEIQESLQAAQLENLIQGLPEGLQTIVGERGLKLSGGERQRIAIARAVLKKPKIYLFDEATSALDTKTERAIQKNLTEISRGATTLIIAHRLSTIVDVDEILVLEKGHVMEKGTHQQLLEQEGIYAALWARQNRRKAPK